MLQGVLHADEYGSASILGGMSLTLSVWQEKAKALLWSNVMLPRVIVQAALQETALHPGIHAVPRLQKILKVHQRTWDAFRDMEMKWLLGHADLVGAVLSEPAARSLWTHWTPILNYSMGALDKASADVCRVRVFNPSLCDRATQDVARYRADVVVASRAIEQWNLVLTLRRWVSARTWWGATQSNATPLFDDMTNSLASLHDIEKVTDVRITGLTAQILDITTTLTANKSVWLHRLLQSLLTGEMWASCLEHVRLREGRVRELMIVAGVQDLVHTHERILNASLRSVSADEKRKVQDWFGELGAYGWWLPEELPNLVRRCVTQEAGDCVRVGPSEIQALTAQYAERARIIEDWVRRALIGLWNATPVVLVLFALELIVMCVPKREAKTVLLRLEGQGHSQKQVEIMDN